jgi:hypothetical protein
MPKCGYVGAQTVEHLHRLEMNFDVAAGSKARASCAQNGATSAPINDAGIHRRHDFSPPSCALFLAHSAEALVRVLEQRRSADHDSVSPTL